MTIFYNTFSNNSAPNAILLTDNNRGSYRPYINYNFFQDPNCTYELNSQVISRSSPVDARYVHIFQG